MSKRKTPVISMIAAIAKNLAIGKKGVMPWHLPQDLKRFKKITTGHAIIMGRKTFESLPFGPLPNRTNIVITKKKDLVINNVIVVNNVEEALLAAGRTNEVFVIGGGEIYKMFFPIADKLYLTEIDKIFPADTFFPHFNKEEWRLEEEESITNEEPFDYSFRTYLRIDSSKLL